jgi:triacylglycerol esterase/lipase EstA (alpha/beta hydrolase family)
MLPTVILPGYLESAPVYFPLAQQLIDRGSPTWVVPVKLRHWLPTIGGRSMVPILQLLHETVTRTLVESGAGQINLIGHSAGGWISRIYLGEQPYTIHSDVAADAELWNARSRVAALICLGTPQFSEEKWTKKNLNFVNDNYPGAFYPEVDYICLAGKTIFGDRPWSLAHQSYKITCGEGKTWGDGITPIDAAYLDGAKNLAIEGVKHSPRSNFWYGSPAALEQWIGFLR